MSIGLGQLIDCVRAKGYYKLAEFLQENCGDMLNKQIEHVVIADERNALSQDDNCLYFCTLEQKNEINNRLAIPFTDEKEMYLSAYLILSIINERERIWYEKIIDTNLKFNDITLKNPDIIRMVNYFNEIMKNPVIIYDEFFNITASTHDYLEEYDRHEDSIEEFEMQNLFYYKQRVTFLRKDAPVKECNRLLFPVLSDEKMPKGYLAIFDVETAYENLDMMILEIFANSVLVEMRRLLNIQDVETKFISDFIYDVVYRKEYKEEEIARRAKRLNVNSNAYYCMVAINPVGKIKDAKLDTNGYITEQQFMYDRIMSHIKNFHTKSFEQDIVSRFNDTTYIMHKIDWKKTGDRKSAISEIKKFCQKIKKMLDEMFFGMTFQIGIGDIVHGLGNISNSFQQCWVTISYGEILFGKDKSFILSYGDNGLLKLFGRLQETNSLEEIIPERLHELIEHDENNNTSLYDTLKMYLKCNCNAKKTAEKMFVHYKTILYRLDKIKNKFDIDIGNSDYRLYIELGIRLNDLRTGSGAHME